MDDNNKLSHGLASGLAGGIGAFLGLVAGWYEGGGRLFQLLLLAAVLLCVLDLLLGIVCSVLIRGEKLSSRKLNRFLMKMVQYGVLIGIAGFMDHAFASAGGQTHVYLLETALLFAFIGNDGTSLLEHLKEMEPVTGFRVPNFIGTKLAELQRFSPKVEQRSYQESETRTETHTETITETVSTGEPPFSASRIAPLPEIVEAPTPPVARP